MRFEECKDGVRVRIIPPKDCDMEPGWEDDMNKFAEGVWTCSGPSENGWVGIREDTEGWAFAPRWLRKA